MAAPLVASPPSFAASGSICGAPPTVTLDVGHTLDRPGAISARGRTEYSFNRALTYDLADALRSRAMQVDIVNEDGKDISLINRARQLAAIKLGIILSLHHDSVQPKYLEREVLDGKVTQFTRYPKARGYSLFVSGRSRAYEASQHLALAVGAELRQAGFTASTHHSEPIKGEGRPVLDAKLGLFRYDALMVLKGARVPAILLEAGVIANPENELELESRARRAQMVTALVKGITSFCRLSE
ncbi:N-acetylmuramoyl-L-alanine amidase family protein [Methyloceanibacter sp.]|uniref:N-acetylmuramoyl-L-alanine amidase family protein n=1 Tax=Methyloceanibacter sp. TaxID=1965321 RepID=UPI003D6CCB91